MLSKPSLITNFRFKHVALVASVLLLITVLGACSNDKDAIGEKQINDLISIQPITLSTHSDRDPMEIDPPDDVTKIELEIKNETSEEVGIGAFNFKAFDKSGNELRVYGYADGLGQTLEKNEKTKGNLYYEVEKGDLALLVYNDPTLKETMEWKFKVK